MPGTENTDSMSFWDHLDVLRAALMKIAVVAIVFGMAAFFFKETLFAVILAPKEAGFTLSLVALPMWVLYEVSIAIVKTTKYK